MGKNILFTGFRAITVGRSPTKRGYGVTNSLPIVEEARKQDWIVDYRVVNPGDDLSKYDKVVVFIEDLNSIIVSYALGALYTLHQRPDAIIVISDMHGKVDSFPQTFKSKSKNVFRKNGFFHNYKEWQKPKWSKIIHETLEKYGNTPWPNKTAFPCVVTGKNKLEGFPSENMYLYDNSPIWWDYYNNINWDYDNKERSWVLSAVCQTGKWLEKQPLAWDSYLVGDKKRGVGRLSELDCTTFHANNWGLLINQYAHIGSGYARYKYVVAAKYGCIPFGHKDELSIIGETWGWCADNLETIESMNNTQLRDLHQYLKREYLDVSWTREQYSHFVCELLKD